MGLLDLVTSKTGLEILCLLRNKPSYTRELAGMLGKREANISAMLRLMEEAGLVTGSWERMNGKNVKTYRLNADKIEISFGIDGCKITLRRQGKRKPVAVASFHALELHPQRVSLAGGMGERVGGGGC